MPKNEDKAPKEKSAEKIELKPDPAPIEPPKVHDMTVVFKQPDAEDVLTVPGVPPATPRIMKEEQSLYVDQLAGALAKAQGELEGAKRETEGQVGSSRKYGYADLSSVINALRNPFAKNGLAYTQTTAPGKEAFTVTVITTLMHTSGQWKRGVLSMSSSDSSPQRIGSAMTYARRYALMAIGGLAAEDDDGASAGKGDEAEKKDYFDKKKKDTEEKADSPYSDDDGAMILDLWEWDTEKVMAGDEAKAKSLTAFLTNANGKYIAELYTANADYAPAKLAEALGKASKSIKAFHDGIMENYADDSFVAKRIEKGKK